MTSSHMESQPTIVKRYTKSGRHLIYRLNVLQEPERARACGSGPKSTTDRRPVDPPPVVELRIFEGPTIEQAKDITFNYNANFFLFATLEHARPIAQGRVQTPAATTPPVLTGMFVSGMAYLDRPAEAGYFLFPDLSVRHEGRYKLLFNLYEETKEDKDRDADPPADSKNGAPSPFEIEDSFDWRMEVQSRPFTVYSAKKFPGLTESTSLSRTISEQGCRVRIRRDVRMRRREGKSSNKDYESREEEYARPRRTQTPELKQDPYRNRSMSNSSMDRTPYHPDTQRRPSVADYPAAPPPPPPAFSTAPPTPSSSSGGGYLQFGHSQTAPYHPQHHYAPPPPQPPQSSPIVPQQPYPPPQRYAQPAPPPPAPAPYRAPQQSPYNYPERPPSQPYQSEYPPPSRDQYEDSRRSSYPIPPAPSAYPEPPRDHYPNRVPTPSRSMNIPPLKNIAPLEPRASPAPHTRLQLPPLMNTMNTMNTMNSPRDIPSSNKRPFNMAFNDTAHSQSLVNGRRQIDPHHRLTPRGPLSHYPMEDPIMNDPDHVQYRRANGDMQIKPLPTCQ